MLTEFTNMVAFGRDERIFPVETTEFSKARGIDRKPDFKWWVNHTLKKRDAFIASVKSRLKKSIHKYSIRLPTIIKHTRAIDKKNGNHLCMEALKMEMENVSVVFDILEDGQPLPVGYAKSSGHLVWDV